MNVSFPRGEWREAIGRSAAPSAPLPVRNGTRRADVRRTRPASARPILVTGFGPFPGAPDNPSAALARALGRARSGGPCVTSRVLPTEWRALDALDDLLRATAPQAVLHIGVAPRAALPRLELRAYNRAAVLPDAAGNPPPARRLEEGGPSIRRACAPSLREVGGTPLRLSLDPGAYLCNALLYRSLASRRPWRPVAFLHVPLPHPRRGAQPADLLTLARAVIDGLRSSALPARPRRQSKPSRAR